MIKLAPSILSADFARLKDEIHIIDHAGCDYIHIDVMDGHFVPNITLGPPVIKSLKKYAAKPFDVHLMISDPNRYIEDFYDAGADILTIQVEACTHLHRTIQRIKQLGMKASVSLNPATSLDSLNYVLDELDMILIMTVNPGFGGQRFIPQMLQKIMDLNKIIKQRGLSIDIEVDGGIGLSNVGQVMEAGANVIVAGSAIYNTPDPAQTVREFIEIFHKYEDKK